MRVNLDRIKVLADAMSEGDPPMYSLCLIIPKSDKETITRLYKAVEAAKEIGKKQLWGGVIPEEIGNPIHDGNVGRPKDPNYKDCVYVNIKSQNKPGVLGMDKKPLLDPLELYSGAYVYVSVNVKPYNNHGKKGVSVWLRHVMKKADGERLAGIATFTLQTEFRRHSATFGTEATVRWSRSGMPLRMRRTARTF